MKRYEVKKENRQFGNKCKWYNKNNLPAVEATNPTYRCGGRQFPAAYFVYEVETVYDPMRDFNPRHEERTPVAGPFSCETIAQEWAEMH